MNTKWIKSTAAVVLLGFILSLSVHGATVTKGLIGEQDQHKWSGTSADKTFTRATSTGGTLTLNSVGYEVDALISYGGGVQYNDVTITSALTAIGVTEKCVLVLRPGTWTISNNLSITSNIVLKRLPGTIISVASGKTLTFADAKQIDSGTYYDDPFSGAGSVAITGGSTYTPASTLTAAVLKALVITPAFATAAEDLAGAVSSKAIAPLTNPQLIKNLKPAVNAAVNKLDIFTKSGGAVADATNIISVAVPDGNGYTFRSRSTTYLSGSSQFVMADGANYWSKGSLDAEIKTAWVYAIWDGTGIVWALSGYSGYTMVPTETTITFDDYFLIESDSTYTRSNAHYCVAVAKIRYQYDTADTPDHTIKSTVLDAPRVIWSPRSDYGKTVALTTTVTSTANIVEDSRVSIVSKQSGAFMISGHAYGYCSGAGDYYITIWIRVGSAAYASAVIKASGRVFAIAAGGVGGDAVQLTPVRVLVNAGDTIHLGIEVMGASGNRQIFGDNNVIGNTLLSITAVD